jgi:copper(I)-binding protein
MKPGSSHLAHAAVLAALMRGSTVAGDTAAIQAQEAWARASIGTARPAAAYLTLTNTGETPVSVTDIETPVAGRAELHRTRSEDGVMQMVPAETVEIPPGGTVAMAPGGLHVMLMDLVRPLNEGERFALTLRLSDGREIKATVPILGPGSRGPEETVE